MSNRNMKVVKVQGPRQNPRKPQKSGSKERGNSSLPGMRLYRKIPDQTRVVRVLRDIGKIVSNASGYVVLGNFKTQNVSSNANWSNISQEFQSYRVRKLVVKLFPVYNYSYAASGANSYPQTVLLMGLFWDQAPASTSNILQTENMSAFSTSREHTIDTNFLGFPDAMLWTPTGNAISSDSVYGIGYTTDNSHALWEASSPMFNYVVEYDIEFQGMQ